MPRRPRPSAARGGQPHRTRGEFGACEQELISSRRDASTRLFHRDEEAGGKDVSAADKTLERGGLHHALGAWRSLSHRPANRDDRTYRFCEGFPHGLGLAGSMATQIDILRTGLQMLPQVAAHNAAATPDLRSIFTPQSHEGALDPVREIVVGDRGVGKSFWSSVLKDDVARTAIGTIYPRLKLQKLSVSLGFSEVIGRQEYPSERTIHSLLSSSISAEIIWRAVILNSVSPPLLPPEWIKNEWLPRCLWVTDNPQKEETILTSFNDRLGTAGRQHLIVFDALDRLGKDWKSIRLLTRSLLTVALDLRSFPAIRAKLFIRPDMESDREIWSIRDGSKLKQTIVNLNWNTRDLYGFVWHWFLLEVKPIRARSLLLYVSRQRELLLRHLLESV